MSVNSREGQLHKSVCKNLLLCLNLNQLAVLSCIYLLQFPLNKHIVAPAVNLLLQGDNN